MVDDREADARRGMKEVVADVDAAGRYHALEALRDNAGRLAVYVRQQHRELVAAQPCDEIGLAKTTGERPPDCPERPVTHGVTVLVVDALEVVEIDHHQRGLLAIAL